MRQSRVGRFATILLGAAAALLSQAVRAQTTDGSALEEIVVTAEKRTELLRETPASISAISGERLESLNVTSLSELAGYVPGLTVSNYGAPGSNTLEIRGLGDGYLSDFAGPLVGTYIDDVPIGSSTAAGRGNLFGLDLVPYDIERVEVLKGPQGTLYGSNAMGGIVRYVLAKPDLMDVSAKVGAEVAHTDGSGGADATGRAMVNLPLVQGVLGVRVSGFYLENAGYIENLGIDKKDSNHSFEGGGRATVLWQPTQDLSLQATILDQNVHSDDMTNVTLNGNTMRPLYGPESTSTHFPQPLSQQTQNFSLELNWSLSFATLTSVAAWSKLNSEIHEDFSNFAAFTGVPGAIADLEIATRTSKFVEETRLTSLDSGPLQWLIGAYFTHQNAGEIDNWPTYTAAYVPLPESDNLEVSQSGYSYREAAGFANLTYKFNTFFDLSAGGRYSNYRQAGCNYTGGLFGAGQSCLNVPSTGINNVEASSTGVWNWMSNARFHLNSNEMLYIRVATGYRPGTQNSRAEVVYGAPNVTKPDRTTNYEVGFKGELLDKRLQLDADVFYIAWRDLQLENFLIAGNRPIVFLGNIGSAVSSGVELSAAYLLTKGLRVNLTTAYTHAYLTANAPESGGFIGDPLPLSARWASSISADYERPLSASLIGLAGATYKYKDSVINQFPGAGANGIGPAADPAAHNPPWNIVDVYVGARLGQLTIRAYGKNVFNDHSYTGLQYINDPTVPRFIPIAPQTFGLSADYRF